MNILTEFPQVYMCGIHRLFKEDQRVSVGLNVTSYEGKYEIHSPIKKFSYDPLTYIVLGKTASKHGMNQDICTWAELKYAEYMIFIDAMKGRHISKISTLSPDQVNQLISFAYYINSSLSRSPYDASYNYENSVLAKQFPEAHKKLMSVL